MINWEDNNISFICHRCYIFSEVGECFNTLGKDLDVRVIVVSARGKIFSAGLDFVSMMQDTPAFLSDDDTARRAKNFHDTLSRYQQSFTQIEEVWNSLRPKFSNNSSMFSIRMSTAARLR